MATPTRIPIKSKHTDTNRDGIQPTTRARIVEMGVDGLARRRAIAQMTFMMLDQTQREHLDAVYHANQVAIYLCKQGFHLHGATRHSWIAGTTGLPLKEVKRCLAILNKPIT